ncbi:phage tail tip lysozyme, partial [Enterococcus haemoperoxidus]
MATQEQTAKQIWDYFLGQGWTKEAIAGLLGNIQSESSVIADRWQGDIIGNMNGGYGLVQWTPATKYIDWATQNGLVYQDVISQCRRIQWEVERNIQWFPNPERLDLVNISFREFTQLKNVKLAAEYFIAFYEHPEYPNQPARARQAENWYNLLKNTSGVTPEQTKKGE